MEKKRTNSIKTKWEVIGDCGSDHRMTCCSIDGGFHAEEKTIDIVDWKAVRSNLETADFNLACNSADEIDDSIKSFSEKLNFVWHTTSCEKNEAAKVFQRMMKISEEVRLCKELPSR